MRYRLANRFRISSIAPRAMIAQMTRAVIVLCTAHK